MDYGRPDLADALASEYVAGTLRGPARRRFESLMLSHPALRFAVRSWEQRLLPLALSVPPQDPSPRVWQGIEARLWPQAQAAPPAAWWQRLSLWRGVSALATAAAVVMAVLVVTPPPPQAPVVVVLQGTGGDAQGVSSFVASFSADGRALVTRPLQQVNLEAGRVLELWAVPPQGAPRSLGLISPTGATVVQRERLPATVLRGGTSALAVSVEPPGGSPTGTPTGPVLYAGELRI
jgi:anti-sigma-K factor RskA